MWLAIEGLVGAGKTTTAELVGQRTKLSSVIEPSQDHPFLEDYYRDPRLYAIETEITFMLLQIHLLREPGQADAMVSDFSPAKNLIFARTNSVGEDLSFLAEVDARLWRGLPRPDLAVFLDVPVDVCLDRIAQRGREYEQGIGATDLTRLRDEYVDSLQTLGTAVKSVLLEGTEPPDAVADVVVQLAGLR